ncbi:MAG TPA: inositol monophosphatase family protein [Candidatus Methylomirabilis sp.]|nr:inositol monophosphatase family protein [Candidatus Methylomirabilis sp.]
MTDMRQHLRAMFADVRQFLVTDGIQKRGIVQQNPHGDVTKEFDYLAEGRIIDYCAREIPQPVRILTEERGEIRTRAGAAAWTLIVDPVDGSENFARGNDVSSVSLALLPGEGTPRPQDVTQALVGAIFSGTVYEGEKGGGAWRNGQPVRCSTVSRLSEALVSIDFNFRGNGGMPRLYPLLASIPDARRFGTAAQEFVAVAHGGADAYVDARDTLSPENYMAAYLIVAEAGGVISDRFGRPLAPIRSMTQGQSIVAAATPALHEAILTILDEDAAAR